MKDAGLLASHLELPTTSLATCWKATRDDGQIFGFTSHDEDIVIDGVTYVASAGISRAAVQGGTQVQAGNTEVMGFLTGEAITAEDLAAGLWDHAEIRIFEVNWQIPDAGQVRQIRGWLGEVTQEGNGYKAELRGLADALTKSIGEIVGPSCTALLGDERCTVDLTDYTATGEVVSVTEDRREFDTDLSTAVVRLTPDTTGAPPAGYFDTGVMTWLTGVNTGRRMEVKTSAADGRIHLQLLMVDTIAPGDTFSVVAGCDKSRDMCQTRYGNVVNMRGFPDLPGADKVLRFGGQ